MSFGEPDLFVVLPDIDRPIQGNSADVRALIQRSYKSASTVGRLMVARKEEIYVQHGSLAGNRERQRWWLPALAILAAREDFTYWHFMVRNH
jgi:hypothetical protein